MTPLVPSSTTRVVHARVELWCDDLATLVDKRSLPEAARLVQEALTKKPPAWANPAAGGFFRAKRFARMAFVDLFFETSLADLGLGVPGLELMAALSRVRDYCIETVPVGSVWAGWRSRSHLLGYKE